MSMKEGRTSHSQAHLTNFDGFGDTYSLRTTAFCMHCGISGIVVQAKAKEDRSRSREPTWVSTTAYSIISSSNDLIAMRDGAQRSAIARLRQPLPQSEAKAMDVPRPATVT